MVKTDTSRWKEFTLNELGFVNYHGERLNKASRIDGNIPFVTAGFDNRGIAQYIGNERRTYHRAITVDMFGNCFFQPNDCAGDDNIYFFVNDSITDASKLFISTCIHAKTSKEYAYVEQFRQTDADALSVTLPVTEFGEPDWAYMDEYMSAVMKESEASLESLRLADWKKTAVDISRWKEFAIGELFDKLNLGIKNPQFNKALDVSEEQTDEFNLPLVNAKHGNNGIMFYGRKEDFETASMTIDIVQNGAIATGDVYAQPQETGVLWDAYLIKPKHEIESEYTLMFLAVVIERAIKERFSYDDKCVWDKASLLKVKLPVDSHGCPDWAYMDAYMQGVMQKSELCINRLKQAFV